MFGGNDFSFRGIYDKIVLFTPHLKCREGSSEDSECILLWLSALPFASSSLIYITMDNAITRAAIPVAPKEVLFLLSYFREGVPSADCTELLSVTLSQFIISS